MTSLTFHGIEVKIIDQAGEAYTVKALYGQPFTNSRGEYSDITTAAACELEPTGSDRPEDCHILVYA